MKSGHRFHTPESPYIVLNTYIISFILAAKERALGRDCEFMVIGFFVDKDILKILCEVSLTSLSNYLIRQRGVAMNMSCFLTKIYKNPTNLFMKAFYWKCLIKTVLSIKLQMCGTKGQYQPWFTLLLLIFGKPLRYYESFTAYFL